MTENQWIGSVEETTFGQAVLERSRQVPVLVDFWAVWCGPCRTLGPILEKLATEMRGRFFLAKIDSDRDPDLARRYGVRGIPSVKLFVDGEVVDEFTGALPEAQVRHFLEQALPGEADKRVGVARLAEQRADWPQAGVLYQEALGLDPEHPGAILGLTRVLIEMGDTEAAQATLGRLKPRDRESVEAKALAARMAFGASQADLERWMAKVAADPDDLGALLGLGEAFVAREQYEEGMERFLEVVRRNRSHGEDAGRKAMLRVFDLLGPGHPLIARYRQRLSALLFA